ncbi:hypothetical protein [Nitrososphaera viennensis]|uniref:Uncharacterized protein n=2 Tax=Nitrososphaera viennensis TaxID=1034015 RepID=A0A060HI84_9ARCH|nr:hypothetical protein [Nitrososphaera viennensis]AIC15253.1 hypothetical protein NVIE_010270 [Nitrososphaera viennensis EN76]UVS70167.1 hypothetical protein NWT39_05100 [Nitrososphaera viennensis]
MDEFEAWQKILAARQRVARMERLNQELYDHLGGAIIYTLEHAKKNHIPLPNREALYRMIERAHLLMKEINGSSDELLQPEKRRSSDDKYTEPFWQTF